MSRGVQAPSGNAGGKGKEREAPSAPLLCLGDVTSAERGEQREFHSAPLAAAFGLIFATSVKRD